MILESPLKIRDETQQLNRATMPIKNVNADSVTTLEIKNAINPIPPIKRRIFPARVNETEILSSLSFIATTLISAALSCQNFVNLIHCCELFHSH